MKNLKIVLTSLAFATLFSCSNSDSYDTPDLSGQCSELTPTHTTPAILGLVNNTLQQFGTAYDDAVIEAYVTSSDEGGNFFKSISLVTVDGAQGFSVPVDAYNLYTKFEPGRKVYIKLKSRYYQINANTKSKEIGSRYNNGTPAVLTDDEVGRIAGVEYQDVLIRGCAKVDESTLVNNFPAQWDPKLGIHVT